MQFTAMTARLEIDYLIRVHGKLSQNGAAIKTE